MDTELARTFLAVVAAGSFVKAAERLHVTQSTVSARIQSLEDNLGCQLFVRNKAGTLLTPAGAQFQRHATTLLRVVAQARQDLGVPRGYRASITIGGRIGIWERLLLDALAELRARAPDVAVRAEIGFEDELMQGLVEGRIDIGVMYTPQSRPGLHVELVAREELVLVATDGAEAVLHGQPGSDYVYVEWGPEFLAKHQTVLPEFGGPALSTNVGWLGLQHILAHGGAGYFPRRLVAQHITEGKLAVVENAPTFELPAYAVYPLERDDSVFGPALEVIRRLAAAA
jgi:LysR family transcriptional regulator, flagellar master operon regulator